jgi:hypothetical protein
MGIGWSHSFGGKEDKDAGKPTPNHVSSQEKPQPWRGIYLEPIQQSSKA